MHHFFSELKLKTVWNVDAEIVGKLMWSLIPSVLVIINSNDTKPLETNPVSWRNFLHEFVPSRWIEVDSIYGRYEANPIKLWFRWSGFESSAWNKIFRQMNSKRNQLLEGCPWGATISAWNNIKLLVRFDFLILSQTNDARCFFSTVLPVIAERKGKQLGTLLWKCLNISSVNICSGLLNPLAKTVWREEWKWTKECPKILLVVRFTWRKMIKRHKPLPKP